MKAHLSGQARNPTGARGPNRPEGSQPGRLGRRLPFYLLLAAFALAVIWANQLHHAQQGTYFFWHRPLAAQLAAGAGYRFPPRLELEDIKPPSHLRAALAECFDQGRSPPQDPSPPVTYPLWGYSALLALIMRAGVDPESGIAIFQWFLAVGSVGFLYRAFRVQERLWHLPLYYPWFVHASVRWPDLVVAAGICLFLYCLSRAYAGRGSGHLILAGLTLGLTFHVRSDYLLLPLWLLPVYLWWRGAASPGSRAPGRLRTALSLAPPWLVYLPWVFHASTAGLSLAPTNGGAVLFVSLGQLPDNPWGRVHHDTAAYASVRRAGLSDPFSAAADRLLLAQFRSDVARHPGAFARKVLRNFRRAVDGQIDGGEFRISASIPLHDRVAGWLKAASGALASPYRWVFRLGELLLLAYLVFPRLRRRAAAIAPPLLAAGAIWLYKLALHSITQYEARHMMELWPLLVMVVLCLGPVCAASVWDALRPRTAPGRAL